MSFFRNIYKVATSVCRKDKSLNHKRANPYVDITQSNIHDLEEDINNEQEKLALMSPKNTLNSNEEENTIIEREANDVIQEAETNEEDREQLPKESSVSPSKILKPSKEEEQIEAGDIEAYSSTEDSEEEENQEEQGPYKKRKMDILSCSKEEEKITRHWTDDLKSIKKSIGRMNRLFEIYEGYKKKRDPLTISDDKMCEEPEIVEQTQECEEVIEDLEKENMPNIVNQNAELFVALEKQIQNNSEFYQASPMKTRVEQQSRRQSCAQDLLLNMPTLLDPAGVGI